MDDFSLTDHLNFLKKSCRERQRNGPDCSTCVYAYVCVCVRACVLFTSGTVLKHNLVCTFNDSNLL